MPKGFGLRNNPMGRIKDLYDTWPITVWDIDYSNTVTKELKSIIGDDGAVREECGTAGYKTTLGSSKNQVSIFNPQIVANILSLYGPKPGAVVFDPFAGGGTRAIACASAGYEYIGVELRQEECAAINTRAHRIDTQYGGGATKRIHLHCGSSTQDPAIFGIQDNTADMLITCPPYYNMEKYDGGADDLSMAKTYDDFCDMLWQVIYWSTKILKPGALSFWIIGLHRDMDSGLLPMHHTIAHLHSQLEYTFIEEIIIYMKNTGSIRRVGNFLKGNNLLIRTHEYCLVFKKGGK